MTPDKLREIGTALYGSWSWRAQMARALGVNVSTVRRWSTGELRISKRTEMALLALWEACGDGE